MLKFVHHKEIPPNFKAQNSCPTLKSNDGNTATEENSLLAGRRALSLDNINLCCNRKNSDGSDIYQQSRDRLYTVIKKLKPAKTKTFDIIHEDFGNYVKVKC